MKNKTQNKSELPKPQYPLNVPILEGWVQVPSEWPTDLHSDEQQFALYIAGKECGRVAIRGNIHPYISASTSFDFTNIIKCNFESKESAMCAIEEVIAFYTALRKKYTNDNLL